MADLDDKQKGYLDKGFKTIVFFAVLGMIAVLIGATMISQAFSNLLK